jgi:hypothetical protein
MDAETRVTPLRDKGGKIASRKQRCNMETRLRVTRIGEPGAHASRGHQKGCRSFIVKFEGDDG